MVNRLRRNLLIGVPGGAGAAALGRRGAAPLRIEITARAWSSRCRSRYPASCADTPAAADLAGEITQVVIADLVGTGLFREIPAEAQIGKISNFDAPVAFADWKAINAQALITGAVGVSGDKAQVRFRLWDVFAQAPLGEGLQFDGGTASGGGWRTRSRTRSIRG